MDEQQYIQEHLDKLNIQYNPQFENIPEEDVDGVEESKQPYDEEAKAEGEGEDPELLDKDAVLIFFNQIGISDPTKIVLIKNGFDNFESLSYISREVLGQLKITDESDIETLLNSLASIAE